MVLRRVLVSGPITALAAASPRRKVNIFGRRTSGPWGGRKEGPQGRKGSVTPLRCVNVGPWSALKRFHGGEVTGHVPQDDDSATRADHQVSQPVLPQVGAAVHRLAEETDPGVRWIGCDPLKHGRRQGHPGAAGFDPRAERYRALSPKYAA